jgi:RND family efflux transporter MFP subunit
MSSKRTRAALLALCLCACDRGQAEHKHESDHPPGHDHHEEGHGHGADQVGVTRWTDELEMFAEHDVAVVDAKVNVLAHVTILDGFQPVRTGAASLELTGPGTETAVAKAPVRPGIFQLSFTPKKAGKYQAMLRVGARGPVQFEIVVHKKAPKVGEDEDPPGVIELLKEQQWGVRFGTKFPRPGELVPAIEVSGVVDTPPGGNAEVGAPLPGRVAEPPGGFPKPGQRVKKRQLLAKLAPTPSAPESAAGAGLAVAEAESRVAAARAALSRAERLHADSALSKRELEDARRESKLAEDVLRAARRTKSVYSGAASGQGSGSWRLTSPIDGVVVSVNVTTGAAVSQGDTLFRIVDPSEFWIRARVPEQDAPRVRADQDARYQVAGVAQWAALRVTGDAPPVSVVSVGRAVDKTSRTVDIIYGLKAPPESLRLGGRVRVALPAGQPVRGLVVPRSAVLNREGRDLVYVQIDGEHFVERSVRVGSTAADEVVLIDGVAATDRVVTLGTQVVRLADRPKGATPHGHVH